MALAIDAALKKLRSFDELSVTSMVDIIEDRAVHWLEEMPVSLLYCIEVFV